VTGWVRLWHDMPTDPKWRTIARKSNQRVGDVIAVFNFIMVNASENVLERGRTHRFDKEDVATALDLSETDLEAILSAMQGKVLDGDVLLGWAKRQPKREDFGASKRKSEWKERQRNALERIGTQGNAPYTDTDTDTDTDTEKILPKGNKRGRALVVLPAGIDQGVWDDFLTIRKAKRSPMSETALAGIEREAKKAGLTLNEALTECTARGWQGFKADWVRGNPKVLASNGWELPIA
jgi:hypothetical protein